MSHIAYHLEAQRKQRVIDRKHVAMARLAIKMVRLSSRKTEVSVSRANSGGIHLALLTKLSRY